MGQTLRHIEDVLDDPRVPPLGGPPMKIQCLVNMLADPAQREEMRKRRLQNKYLKLHNGKAQWFDLRVEGQKDPGEIADDFKVKSRQPDREGGKIHWTVLRVEPRPPGFVPILNAPGVQEDHDMLESETNLRCLKPEPWHHPYMVWINKADTLPPRQPPPDEFVRLWRWGRKGDISVPEGEIEAVDDAEEELLELLDFSSHTKFMESIKLPEMRPDEESMGMV
eukprot:Platyproteum_vivax@DN5017_c0_g1_i2.p1